MMPTLLAEAVLSTRCLIEMAESFRYELSAERDARSNMIEELQSRLNDHYATRTELRALSDVIGLGVFNMAQAVA